MRSRAKFADVEHIGVARDGKANLLAKAGFCAPESAANHADGEATARAPGGSGFHAATPGATVRPRHRIAQGEDSQRRAPSGSPRQFVFVSPFHDAALMSIDGFGDFASTMTGMGRGSEIEIFDRTLFPHSMGVVYTAICQFIGYDRYGDEGKVMGLAPYGKDLHRDFFDELVKLEANGRFRLNLDYFIHHTEGVDYSFDESGKPTVAPLYSNKLVDRFGKPRGHGEELTDREMNIARIAAGVSRTRLLPHAQSSS